MSDRGLLGDSATRDYSRKLELFNSFAEPELRQAVASLSLKPGMSVLDAGCGTGAALGWFAHEVGPSGLVIGFDLAGAHAATARASAPTKTSVLQADLLKPPLAVASFDVVWCMNTINHLRDPLVGVATLMSLARSNGCMALGQSSLLPDMYFAWDARLERRVSEAVHHYYQDRYGISERDLIGLRALVGLLRHAGTRNVTARTFPIERVSPIGTADEEYLRDAIFRDTWGERLRPYLSADDNEELDRLCDPDSAGYALTRPDFHFIQTFTLVTGRVS